MRIGAGGDANARRQTRRKKEKMFSMSLAQFSAALKNVTEVVGFQHLNILCHSCRHAGASWNAQTHFRSSPEIQ